MNLICFYAFNIFNAFNLIFESHSQVMVMFLVYFQICHGYFNPTSNLFVTFLAFHSTPRLILAVNIFVTQIDREFLL